jgi:hypothetical protein
MPCYNRHEYQTLELRLKTALDASRERLERSKREFDQATANTQDFRLFNRDGSQARKKASHRLALATRDYREALKQWCDFVLRGKTPRKSESRRAH